MVIKKITQIGNPIIRKKSKVVKSIASSNIKRIVKNLADSMRHYDLVGMAAPQIGKNLRIFVTEIRNRASRKKIKKEELDGLRIFINPKLKQFSERQVIGYEGCGSVARGDIFGKVKRAYGVSVEALDKKGDKFSLRATKLLARVIQHEFDHLEGIVFLDRVSDTKSLMSKEEYLKL